MSRFPLLFRSFSRGAIKRGWGTSGTFKVINLTYLHILRAGMVYITLWYVHVPRYVHIPLGSRYLLGQHKPPLKFNFKGILFYTILTQRYVHVPKLWPWSELTIGTCAYQTDHGTCTYHRDIYAIVIAIAHTKVPLSSART